MPPVNPKFPIGVNFSTSWQPQIHLSIPKANSAELNSGVLVYHPNLRKRVHEIGFQPDKLIIFRGNPGASFQRRRVRQCAYPEPKTPVFDGLVRSLSKMYLPRKSAVESRQTLAGHLIISRVERMKNQRQRRQPIGDHAIWKLNGWAATSIFFHAQNSGAYLLDGNQIVELSLVRRRGHAPLADALVHDRLRRCEPIEVMHQGHYLIPSFPHNVIRWILFQIALQKLDGSLFLSGFGQHAGQKWL